MICKKANLNFFNHIESIKSLTPVVPVTISRYCQNRSIEVLEAQILCSTSPISTSLLLSHLPSHQKVVLVFSGEFDHLYQIFYEQ